MGAEKTVPLLFPYNNRGFPATKPIYPLTIILVLRSAGQWSAFLLNVYVC